MNRKEHLTVGLVLFIAVYFILNHFNLSSPLVYSGMIFIGAVLPDYIEPATSFKHRSTFHSKRALKYIFYGMLISIPIGLFFHMAHSLTFLFLGYESHLLIDATTPMGLPN